MELARLDKVCFFKQSFYCKLLLIHGEQDEIVSSNFLLEAKDFFERNKFNIQTKLINNCGHHIPIEASSLALSYIKKNLDI